MYLPSFLCSLLMHMFQLDSANQFSSANTMLRVHLHWSKLAFKPSFKPTKVDAALNFSFLTIIYSYRLKTTTNHF